MEAKFSTVSGAIQFRREGVRLAKAHHPEFDSLFFSNSVNQSTRVRIEILKALAKKLVTETEDAIVHGFISRPALQYKAKEGTSSDADGVGRSYTFVDAIAKFGSLLGQADLATAYVRAGNTFNGALSQYFLVLTDRVPRPVQTGSNSVGLGRRGGSYAGRARSRGFPPRSARSGLLYASRGVKRTGDSSDVGSTPVKKTQEQENSAIEDSIMTE